MELNRTHRKNLAVFYFCCFLISYCWLFFNGWLFSQLRPVFFLNKLDLSLNLLFLTGIQSTLGKNHYLQLLLDIVYIVLPLLLVISVNRKAQVYMAILHSLFSLVYALLLSSFTPLSILGFAGWILLPLIFIFRSERGFYFSLNSMRYIFLLILISTGLWKIRAGGIFNPEEMSGILLKQHAAYLVHAPGDWFTNCINYLVIHQNLSYLLYLMVTLAELSFVIGFFTKRFDKVLILVFLLFVLFNFLLMRINYFAWIAFLGCLRYAKYREPGSVKT